LRIRAAVAVALVAAVALPRPAAAAVRPHPGRARALTVAGNLLVTDGGTPVQLRGVNRSTPETRCQGLGVTSYFAGPTDAPSVRALRTWGVTAVRVPVNEDCWLGRNGLPAGGDAAAYRAQLTAYARLLVAGGIHVVVDVHFAETTVAGVVRASAGPAPMLDAAHGPELWRSIAATFADERAVAFDLYNEPHDVSWACWRDGCADPLTGSRYAGMQALVDAVRSTGAANVLVATGPSWGNELSRWTEYAPRDPLGRLVAGVHVYPESGCATVACLDERVAPVAARVPVLVGEFGDTGCTGAFLEGLAAWADAHGVSYLAFTWNPAAVACVGYHLVVAFDGTPTAAGLVYRDHLRARRDAERQAWRPLP
jgi:hypothetical protein